MSVKVPLHLTSDEDQVLSTGLMTFCMQLVHHSQWKSVREFSCGSFVEIPYQLKIVRRLGLTYTGLDKDQMVYGICRYAVHRSASLPEQYTDDIIQICTDDVHTGYVRLIREKDNTEIQLSDLHMLKYNVIRHGPAMCRDNRKPLSENKYSLSNDETDVAMYEKKLVSSEDVVYAIHSPYWPVEANEWITRRRSHGFPSKSVIKQVVRYGCDFVQVSHNRLNNDGEWRFSFSKAEQIIIKSWSISQRIVYASLWALNKRIASSNLCTYYFKTLMFWACEEKPNHFWHEDLLNQSLCELLVEMMKWINSKFCVNYFIPGNNMMDHLIDTDLSYEIDALWSTSQSHELLTNVIHICRRFDLAFDNATIWMVLPTWIRRAFIIYQRINNEHDNYDDCFSTYLTLQLQNSIYNELSDIYKALRFQQRSASSINMSENETYIKRNMFLLNAEIHLFAAVNLCESLEKINVDNSNLNFSWAMNENFMLWKTYLFSETCTDQLELSIKHKSTADWQSSIKDSNEQKCLLYSRTVKKHENKLVNNYGSDRNCEGRNVNVALYEVNEMHAFVDSTHICTHLYKEWPGQSPTVNISWFIAKAYLANLYYTTQRDVSLTTRTCDDINYVYRQSYMNQMFAETTFPIVLSTQWTNIYDKVMQELLGFISLCCFVFDPSSRSVYLSVCPIQFAQYIKLRAVTGLDVFKHCYTIRTALLQYHNHHDICRSTEKNGYGTLALHIAVKFCSLGFIDH